MTIAANGKRFPALLLHNRFPMGITKLFQTAHMMNFVHFGVFVPTQLTYMRIKPLLYCSSFGKFALARDSVINNAFPTIRSLHDTDLLYSGFGHVRYRPNFAVTVFNCQ